MKPRRSARELREKILAECKREPLTAQALAERVGAKYGTVYMNVKALHDDGCLGRFARESEHPTGGMQYLYFFKAEPANEAEGWLINPTFSELESTWAAPIVLPPAGQVRTVKLLQLDQPV